MLDFRNVIILLLDVTILMEVEIEKIHHSSLCHAFSRALCTDIILCSCDYSVIGFLFFLLHLYHCKIYYMLFNVIVLI